MTTAQILQLVLLAEQAVQPILKLVGDLKSQSGKTTDELLAEAEAVDADTRARVAAFLATLPAE